MKKVGKYVLSALLLALIVACGSRTQAPTGMVEVRLELPTLASQSGELAPQGIPFDDNGDPVVTYLRVEIFDENGNPVTPTEAPQGFVELFDTAPSATLTLPAGGYTFVSYGYDTNDLVIWVAYGEDSVTLSGNTQVVQLFPKTLLESATLTPSAPVNAVVPGQQLDLMLTVTSPFSPYTVPLADFEVAYNLPAAMGSEVASSKRGIRLDVTTTPTTSTFEMSGDASGWRNLSGTAVANQSVTAPFSRPFAGDGSTTIVSDFEAPSLTFNVPATAASGAPLTLTGTADDNYGVDRVQLYDGPVLIASSHSGDLSDPSVSQIVFNGTSWSVDWTPPNDGNFDLVAVAIDSSGNQTEAEGSVTVGESSSGGTPEAPSGVTAVPSTGFVMVTWLDNSDNESGFTVYREEVVLDSSLRVSPQTITTLSMTVIGEVGPNTISYQDAGVNPGVTYRYAVAATGTGGNSAVVTQTGDPVTAESSPTAPLCQVNDIVPGVDSDGDGISDAAEATGWTVSVDTNGQGSMQERQVTSDPTKADTDGDGLCDAEEQFAGSDPRSADTDQDGLTDFEELKKWGSSLNNVDSDGDATNLGSAPFNTQLRDGYEAKFLGTSPVLYDSDGDAYTDYVEVLVRDNPNGYHPLIADVPLLQMEQVGEIDLGINISYSDSTTEEETVEVSLEQGTSSEVSNTDTTSREVSAELSVTVGTSVEVEASFPPGVTGTVSTEVSATAGYSYNTSNSLTRTAVNDSRQAYGEATSKSREEGREITSGTIAVGMQFHNPGLVSFFLDDMEITVLRRDPSNPTSFRTIGTMTRESSFSRIALGPGQSTGIIRFSKDLPANVALELLANPEAIFFSVGSYSLAKQDNDAWRDVDFAFLAEKTTAQTALIVIDYGNGSYARHRVATNVAREGNTFLGLNLTSALEDVLQIPYETTQNDAGISVLTSVRDERTQTNVSANNDENNLKFWAVVGTPRLGGAPFPNYTDFENIVLRGGDTLYLMFIQDDDRDGLYAREEYFYGSDDQLEDTDGDGLTDYQEVRTGWDVLAQVPPYYDTTGVPLNTQVFSDPVRSDSDFDGLSDLDERSIGSDPNNPDTDGDGFCDGSGAGPSGYGCPGLVDPDPIDPSVTPNEAPSIDSFSVSIEGLSVSANLSVSDPDGNLKSVDIEWGDGSTDTFTQGFSNLTKTHTYSAPGLYTVLVTATDEFELDDEDFKTVTTTLPESGIVGEYLFTNGSAADTSGQGNDGRIETLGKCVFTSSDRDNQADSALDFLPNDRQGNCGNADTDVPYFEAPGPAIDDSFSLTLWLKNADTFGADRAWIAGQRKRQRRGPETPWMRVYLGIDESAFPVEFGEKDKISFVLPENNGGTTIELIDPNEPGAGWTFYAVTVTRSGSSSTAKLYRGSDGGTLSEVASQTASGDYSNPAQDESNLYVGGHSDSLGTDDFYQGQLDDVRIFDRGLTQGELDALFRE